MKHWSSRVVLFCSSRERDDLSFTFCLLWICEVMSQWGDDEASDDVMCHSWSGEMLNSEHIDERHEFLFFITVLFRACVKHRDSSEGSDWSDLTGLIINRFEHGNQFLSFMLFIAYNYHTIQLFFSTCLSFIFSFSMLGELHEWSQLDEIKSWWKITWPVLVEQLLWAAGVCTVCTSQVVLETVESMEVQD